MFFFTQPSKGPMEENNLSCRTICKWTDGFALLYSGPDSNRRPEEFWNATMAHISVIGEAIRKSNYREILSAAAHAFCWMCCYIDTCRKTPDPLFRINNTFSDIVGLKFPERCGHCMHDACSCDPAKMDEQKDKSSKYSKLLKHWKKLKFETYMLDTWLDTFWDIYSGRIHLSTIENIGFHLLEEAGEEALAVRQLVQFRGITDKNIEGIDSKFLSKISSIPNLVSEYNNAMMALKKRYTVETDKEAISKIDFTSKEPVVLKARLLKGKMDFVIEFADTFSWYCAVLLKLRTIIKQLAINENNDFRIENELNQVYKSSNDTVPLVCPSCNKAKCSCLFYPEESKETKKADSA
jgi:hypothetical protein